MVLLKAFDERGFVFYTNYGSRKAAELDANPWAALCFHWAWTGKQFRAEGAVSRVSAEESDAYFATRSHTSRVGAWASRQSEPYAARAELEAEFAACERRFAGRPVPRPDFWTGYRVVPARIEFWREQPSRLHDRLVYTRTDEGWTTQWLYP